MSFIDQNVGNGWNGGTNGFPFNGAGRPSINTAFNQALSDYELICMIRSDVDKLIVEVTNFETNVLNLANQYTDVKVKEVSDALHVLMNEYKGVVDSELQDFRLQIANFSVDIAGIYISLEEYRRLTDERFSVQYAELVRYVNDSIQRVSLNMVVRNPRTGEYQNINYVLSDMFEKLNWCGITWDDLDGMGLTYDDLANMHVTYDAIGVWGKVTFFDYFFLWCTNPMTYKRDSIKNVINDLAGLHKNSITWNALIAKGWTYDDITNKHITAYDSEWKGATVFV